VTRRVFVSYRRDDSKHAAGRLAERLDERFTLFMDVTRIRPGSDFTTAIREAVDQADVLLAVIGSQWLTVTAADGGRLIDQPDDWVVLEVAAALRRRRGLGSGKPSTNGSIPTGRPRRPPNRKHSRWCSTPSGNGSVPMMRSARPPLNVSAPAIGSKRMR
jgi:hypothetical protein